MGKEMKSSLTGEALERDIEVSIVMPCLNEADTLETCLKKAFAALDRANISGEVVVADNGSTDGSKEITLRNNARLVEIADKGYGHALMGGIESAYGRYVIMGDADDSYDFEEIPRFVEKLREGNDLVMGCRLPSGGGRVMPNAMPFLHRWLGNPAFSWMCRLWFNSKLHDVHCGLRGFTKDFYRKLDQKCTGMEFATEMTIKASMYGFKVDEIPITLYPDGRIGKAPHLKTFRDGWRHLRLYLMYSPRWLFLYPGFALVLIGILVAMLGLFGVTIDRTNANDITFGVHTVVFGSLAVLCGYQSVLFAVFTKVFAITEGLFPEDHRLTRFAEVINLEKALLVAVAVLLFGLGLLVWATLEWRASNFGPLDAGRTMKLVIPGATIVAVAFQTIFSSFFVSILGMKRK
jgi:glycosyltransferase involved in cell wall biosynthesis